jgi:hypothetical protein
MTNDERMTKPEYRSHGRHPFWSLSHLSILSSSLAEQFAGRFLEKEFVYAYSQFRNGPSHTNLTEKYERKIAPRGPWRYNRQILLLIGQKCMSSNESFIGMMTGDPEFTTMGDHTCGSSGNPEIVQLPLDMTVSVRWGKKGPEGTSSSGLN